MNKKPYAKLVISTIQLLQSDVLSISTPTESDPFDEQLNPWAK